MTLSILGRYQINTTEPFALFQIFRTKANVRVSSRIFTYLRSTVCYLLSSVTLNEISYICNESILESWFLPNDLRVNNNELLVRLGMCPARKYPAVLCKQCGRFNRMKAFMFLPSLYAFKTAHDENSNTGSSFKFGKDETEV